MSVEAKALSNAVLKGIMVDAVCDRGVIGDMNADNPSGVYVVDQNITQNLPSGMKWGRVLQLNSQNMIAQLIFDWSQEKMYVRMASTANLSHWYNLTFATL